MKEKAKEARKSYLSWEKIGAYNVKLTNENSRLVAEVKSLKEESVKLQNKVAKYKRKFDSSEANVEIEIKRANDAAQEAAPYLQLEEYVKAEKERMEIQSPFDLDATLRSYRRVYREIIDDLLGDFRALKDRLVDEVQVPREQLPVTPPPSALSVRENEEEGEEVVSQVAEDVAPGGVLEVGQASGKGSLS